MIQRGPCTPVFIAAMSTIAEPRCPWTDEWTEKMWYIYDGILFSHQKNEILPFATMWLELEWVMLSDISQAEKDNYHMISCVEFKKQNRIIGEGREKTKQHKIRQGNEP